MVVIWGGGGGGGGGGRGGMLSVSRTFLHIALTPCNGNLRQIVPAKSQRFPVHRRSVSYMLDSSWMIKNRYY